MNYLLNILGTVDLHDFVTVELELSVPTIFCLLIWVKSPSVKPLGRLLVTMAGLSLFGWAITVVAVFAGPVFDNGFAYICAVAFGWAYAWILGVPVLLLSFLLRALDGFVSVWWILRKATGRGPCGWSHTACIVILVVSSLVFYPLCLAVKPSEMWKEWNGRQYSAKSVQGIVHVQIREGGKIVDVRSDASGYHHFHVEPLSADELLLKSSDVGLRIIRKVDGEWVVQDAASNQE